MLGKENLVLTFASGADLFKHEGFWVYVNSLRNVDADHVFLAGDMDAETSAALMERGCHVADVLDDGLPAPGFVGHGDICRDRHLVFWDYLNNYGYRYKLVLVADCRDVVFQSDPFLWVGEWRRRFDRIRGDHAFLNHFVVMSGEGFRMKQSGFACIERFEFERDVPRPFLDDENRWVVNGGIALGTPRALQDFQFLVWVTTVKTIGRVTDQASINWLMRYLDRDATYSVSPPQHDHLCLTGEGVKEGAVTPVIKDGVLYNPVGNPYCMVHQWDRLDGFRESTLAHYLR